MGSYRTNSIIPPFLTRTSEFKMRRLFVFSLFFHCYLANASRILFIPAHGVPSHTKSMYLAAEALKRAGHDVSVLQLLDSPEKRTRNKAGVTDRVIEIKDDDWIGSLLPADVIWRKPSFQALLLLQGYTLSTSFCMRILSNETSRNALHAVLNETWDAVLMDDFYPICGLVGLKRRLFPEKAVIVDFATMLLFPFSIEPRGAHIPLSSPGPLLEEPYFDYRNVFHRLQSVLYNLQLSAIMQALDYIIPYNVKGQQGDLHDMSLSVLPEQSAFAVTSVPNGLDFTQPRSLEIVEFDNTCSNEASVPEPFDEFIRDPRSEGTILFAMGHFVVWDQTPARIKEAFVQAFAKLPQYRIIWQFNSKTDPPKNLPSNILFHRWVPQAAILNHPKTKAFISHMGYKSFREAICARVPVVAMPMFGDQYRNTATAQHRRIAVFLDKTQLSVDSVYQAVTRVLDDDRYSEAIGRLQDRMADRIRNASEMFTFQLEYFVRRNERRIFQKFIRNKWKNLSVITRWWQGDLAAPLVVSLLVASSIIM